MKRREFITLLAGATAAWPLAARAQPATKPPAIGFLGANTLAAQASWTAVFLQRLRELGWNEGRNITIEYRWADGRSDRAREIAAEFARIKVDLIFTSGTANVLAAKDATSTIPIVFAAAANPVDSGLVASLAYPGGNITGFSVQQPDLAGKRLDVLREIVPRLRRLAVMGDLGSTGALADIEEVRGAAGRLGVEAVVLGFRRTEEIAGLFDGLAARADALYVASSPLVTTNRLRINVLALGARLPTMHGIREHAADGGLISYGTSFPDLFRRAGDLVDKILRGGKPADIPVEQPTKFDLVVNLITAKALGLELPSSILLRADEVIE